MTKPIILEAPMGTGTTVIETDGFIKHIPFSKEGIDWEAFEKLVSKINKLREKDE